jgi:hypothetical protein
MKRLLVALAVLGLIVFALGKQRADIGKEEGAIKALFEAEKAAFFERNAVGVGEAWAKEPTSMKIYLSPKGPTKYAGWDDIEASIRKEAADDSWDRKQVTATFSNYRIDVMGDSAWVVCDTDWSGVIKEQPWKLKQSRISVLKKIDGKWKFALMAVYEVPGSRT